MNLNSKYFDRIRVSPNERPGPADMPACEWKGCGTAGGYRAPKGRHREGQYHNFCLGHVREYNKNYNYFAGMANDDVIAFQRSAETGHRPTWTVGVNPGAGSAPHVFAETINDPFGVFGGGFHRAAPPPKPERRALKNLERKSFAALDLDGHETAAEIKARYKELVTRLHPDANGGDRGSEDRLRQTIQAYHYLKSAGFC